MIASVAPMDSSVVADFVTLCVSTELQAQSCIFDAVSIVHWRTCGVYRLLLQLGEALLCSTP